MVTLQSVHAHRLRRGCTFRSWAASPSIFLDNGVSPDVTAGDGIYSASTLIDSLISAGNRNVNVTITEHSCSRGHRVDHGERGELQSSCVRRFGFLGRVRNGEAARSWWYGSRRGRFPDSTGIQATADLSAVTGDPAQVLFDDGTNGDVTAGDNIFSYAFRVCNPSPGTVRMNVSVSDAQGRSVMGDQATTSGRSSLASGAWRELGVRASSSARVSMAGAATRAVSSNDFIDSSQPQRVPGRCHRMVGAVRVQLYFSASGSGLPGCEPCADRRHHPRGRVLPRSALAGCVHGTQPAPPTPDAIGTVTVS